MNVRQLLARRNCCA
jgi:hypothetical protein